MAIVNKIMVLFLVFFFPISMASSCVYTVRDVGFVDIGSTHYQLCYYVKNNTPQDTINVFKQLSYAALTDSNIDVKIINIDQKTDKQEPMVKYLQLLGIQTFPTAILVSPKGQHLVLPAFQQSSIPRKEAIWSAIENIVASPKRDEILKHIIKSHSVVLLIQGKNSEENNAKAKAVISESIKEIRNTMSQMPKSVEEPPYLITITPDILAQEKILLWSLGLNEKIDKPRVAILYGKGRQIGTLLNGENITVNKIFNVLSIIGSSCECGLDRKWVQGMMIPLRWGIKTQLDTAKYLGFDPESPVVKTEISQILATDTSLDTEDFQTGEYESGTIQPNKYSERVVEFESSSKVLSPVQVRKLAFSDSNSKDKSDDNIPDKDSKGPGFKNDKSINHKESKAKASGSDSRVSVSKSVAKASLMALPRGSKSIGNEPVSPNPSDDSRGIQSIYHRILLILGCMFLLILAGGFYIALRAKIKLKSQ